MTKKTIKLNLKTCNEAISAEEKDKKLVDFFALLFEWKLEDLANNNESEAL